MAKANQLPTLDVQVGAAALDEDIPRVLRLLNVDSLDQLGWSRPNRLVLLVPMAGILNGVWDTYLLRLGFQAYRTWPPSAQFVNPETGIYSHPGDKRFIPRLTSPECHTHDAYNRPNGGTMQLVCCSAVLEFYEISHPVNSEHVWRETDTFFTTISALHKAFASFYGGRF
jgi:hypothetical protein